jgi:hypothetical protein
MNRMVDDLMLLAKAERPDFLSPSQTDLTDLVMETIAKAAALGDRRWVIGELAEATVYADGQRLTQALMQLCANAVAHTRPGDEIRLSSRIVDDRFHLVSPTRAAGSPPPTGNASSNGSYAVPTACAAMGPGWGCPSSRRSHTRTAAGCWWTASGGTDRASRSIFRWRRRGPNRSPRRGT